MSSYLSVSCYNITGSYDYISIVSALVFNSSSPSRQCVTIPVLDDNRPESTKTFTVVIVTEHPKAIIDRGRATVVIRDNDGQFCMSTCIEYVMVLRHVCIMRL